jgi:hypothetical protein
MWTNQGQSRLQVLLVACFDGRNAQTITDHIEALERYSRHRVLVYNHLPALTVGQRRLPASLDLDRFDVVAIHYSMYLVDEEIDYLGPAGKSAIARFPGVKAQFRQDEYNHVDGLMTVLQSMGVDVLFTNFPEGEALRVYPESRLPRLRRESNLTGYISESFLCRQSRPLTERGIDVGYRSRDVPLWLGALGAEKSMIAREFERRARSCSLVTDISVKESDRLYGEHWPAFLGNCRAVLGTESGASVIDFTGDIRRRCDEHIARHPDATFEEVQRLYFHEHEGLYHLEQISPRCFEAACMRTGMILFEGRYSDILEPGRHYIPLRKDFSNFEQVIRAVRDIDRLQDMVDRTHAEIALNPKYSFRSFVARFDGILEEEFARKGVPAVMHPYSLEEFERCSITSFPRQHVGIAPISPVTVVSSLAFELANPAVNMVNGDADVGYAAAVAGQPLPQQFELALPRIFAVHRVRLIWESFANRATDFSVELMRGSTVVDSAGVQANADVDVSVPFNWSTCRRVRVRINALAGEQRLMVRAVDIYGTWRPLGTIPFRPLLQKLWTGLPDGVLVRAREGLGRVMSLRERLSGTFGPGSATRALRPARPAPMLWAESDLRMYPDFGFDKALDSDIESNYAAAIENQPLPHSFDIRASRSLCAEHVRILWESPQNLARDFTITALRHSKELFRVDIQGNDQQDVAIDLNGVRCDCVRVVVHAYQGQERILLRLIQLVEDPRAPKRRPARTGSLAQSRAGAVTPGKPRASGESAP